MVWGVIKLVAQSQHLSILSWQSLWWRDTLSQGHYEWPSARGEEKYFSRWDFFLSRWDKYVCVCQERITGVIKGGEEYDKIKTSPLLTEPLLANIRSPDAHKWQALVGGGREGHSQQQTGESGQLSTQKFPPKKKKTFLAVWTVQIVLQTALTTIQSLVNAPKFCYPKRYQSQKKSSKSVFTGLKSSCYSNKQNKTYLMWFQSMVVPSWCKGQVLH